MITGEYRTYQRIKEDAEPIDNIVKFAWDDDDYETVTEWHEYTPAELADKLELERERIKNALRANIDPFIEFLENLSDITDPLRMAAAMVSGLKNLKDIARQNRELRKELNDLEGE